MEVGAFFPIERSRAQSPGAAAELAESRAEAAQGFEAMLARSLASTLLKPAMESGLIGKGPGSSVLSSLLEDTVAEQWARSGSLGVAEAVERAMEAVE